MEIYKYILIVGMSCIFSTHDLLCADDLTLGERDSRQRFIQRCASAYPKEIDFCREVVGAPQDVWHRRQGYFLERVIICHNDKAYDQIVEIFSTFKALKSIHYLNNFGASLDEIAENHGAPKISSFLKDVLRD